ncbi:MAG: hypothetical protein JWN70_5324 [Planctomycetaceae bacterium]|nr:hypothetical protein [Planctomycetaceae bacterium]
MSRNILAIVVVFGSVAFAADLSEKWQKRLDSADGIYQAAKMKADNARFYAMQKANADRLKLLKTALADATKAGDFDAATAIKERVAAVETDVVGSRPKPKNTVKIAGHEYALVEEKATWHVAKQICEEMGGHLATINSQDESRQLLALCKTFSVDVWMGETDEKQEGKWQGVDGSTLMADFSPSNGGGFEHYMFYEDNLGNWDDGNGGVRLAFVCEWDN